MNKKVFVLDTNVLLHDPNCIFKFDNNIVVIPLIVLEELDTFKKDLSDLGRNSRKFSRIMDELRTRGELLKGVSLENEGIIKVVKTTSEEFLNNAFISSKADYKILASALKEKQDTGMNVILISKDINLRVKADILGIEAEDYKCDNVKFEDLYTGFIECDIDSETINNLYSLKVIEFSQEFYANQYILLKNGSHSAIARYLNNKLYLVNRDIQNIWGIKPKNLEQTIAIDLLLNDSIKLVSLVGKAGTGKTLIALAAGLSKTLDNNIYKKMLVARPIFPMGKDIGYLPGTIEEKLNPWMQPIFDNIEFLLNKSDDDRTKTDELIKQGLIAIEPLTYIRGRSIPQQYILIDEAQNLSPLEVKTIITRAGDNTKIILTGDCNQIDNPYIDASSNGLSYIVDKFKNEAIAGHITLTKGERSELAELASNIL